jgi:hydrogenase expression/formation protein HypE
MSEPYPLGKLPPGDLAALLGKLPVDDPRVILGPRPGEDAAVLDAGIPGYYLIAKTDPITFATDEIGWYAVHVNANDIATTGAAPAWFMASLLMPGGIATRSLTAAIFEQIGEACRDLGISMIGGHTEITHGIDRPILTGMMLGLVPQGRLISTGGAQPGDALIVTKGVPVEATALIAREKADRLADRFDVDFLARCANFLHDPGISVVRDAQIAVDAGRVRAMHDPTEGGLITGFWEMADAASVRLSVNLGGVLLPEGKALCDAAGLDPLGAIASGALLLAAHADDGERIAAALEEEGIAAHIVGHVEDGPAAVIDAATGDAIPRPARDEIAKLYE